MEKSKVKGPYNRRVSSKWWKVINHINKLFTINKVTLLYKGIIKFMRYKLR